MINILIIPKELGMGLLINYLVFFHLPVWLALKKWQIHDFSILLRRKGRNHGFATF